MQEKKERRTGGEINDEAPKIRTESNSPKRKLPTVWGQGRRTQKEGKTVENKGTTEDVKSNLPTARGSGSASLVKASEATRAHLPAVPSSKQRFIHQFLTKEPVYDHVGKSTGKPMYVNVKHAMEETKSEDDCIFIHATEPGDVGTPLQEWLDALGGSVVDVVPNGHCGWLAFYGALTNTDRNLQMPCGTRARCSMRPFRLSGVSRPPQASN
ncbi:hypothetical protein DVH05_026557 [Phytophthora capsici]|nr:hypothetical protein DVH05_026557 [Phytophthora capsici]